MAHVQLAVSRGPDGFKKLVVLKSLKESFATEPEVVAMFRHEARLAARLNHPNVVQTYEVTDVSGQHVMVMEFLDGQPLSSVIKEASAGGGLARGVHLRILCDALAGLHHAHELADFNGDKLGMVHRDVSPQNVFVTYDGLVKVLDFGIAKVVSGNGIHTQVGVIKGKIRYMAPEQMLGDAIDRRADIFAAGVMLWEALAKKKMWAQLADFSVMKRVTEGKFPSLLEANPQVPDFLVDICSKAMAPRPDDRYESAQQFEFELEAALDKLGEQPRPHQVGRAVATLFAGARATMKALIESELSGSAGLQRDSFVAGSELTPTHDSATTQAAPVKMGRRRFWPVTAILLALAAGGVAAFAGRHAFRASAAPVAPLPTASVASVAGPQSTELTAAPPAATIQLEVTVTPPGARVYLDDTALPSNPYVGSFPRSLTKHVLRGEASGRTAKTIDLTFDKDAHLVLALEREKEAPPPAARAPRPPPPVPPPQTAATGTAPNCKQPYYMGEDGIKKIRAECL